MRLPRFTHPALGAAALAGLAGLAAASAADGDVGFLPSTVGSTQLYVSDLRSGVALSGYDPVSYLTDPAPRLGNTGFELISGGLIWRFASAGNRAAFARDPAAFCPRLGGYDPVFAADGKVVSTDPLVYALRDGRLYLFRNARNRDRFMSDERVAASAEAEWPRLRAGLVRG